MKHPHAERVDEAQRLGADPIARSLIEAMKGQLLIVLVNRLGGDLTIPISEVDGTGGWVLSMSVDPAAKTFTFKTGRKN